MKHKHHILPRHAGGTDDPSNLVELTIEEHAEAHRVLYETHGRWQDKMAWQLLSGQIGKEELMAEIAKNRMTPEVRLKMSMTKRGRKLTEEHKEKIKLGSIGKKQPQSQKDKVSVKMARDWLITEPDGTTYEIKNLRQWCKQHNVDGGNLMSHGKSKGYKCERINR